MLGLGLGPAWLAILTLTLSLSLSLSLSLPLPLPLPLTQVSPSPSPNPNPHQPDDRRRLPAFPREKFDHAVDSINEARRADEAERLGEQAAVVPARAD